MENIKGKENSVEMFLKEIEYLRLNFLILTDLIFSLSLDKS